MAIAARQILASFLAPWEVYGSWRIGPVSLEGSFAAVDPPTENQGITEETGENGDEKGWKGLMHLARVDSDSLVDLSIMNLGVKNKFRPVISTRKPDVPLLKDFSFRMLSSLTNMVMIQHFRKLE